MDSNQNNPLPDDNQLENVEIQSILDDQDAAPAIKYDGVQAPKRDQRHSSQQHLSLDCYIASSEDTSILGPSSKLKRDPGDQSSSMTSASSVKKRRSNWDILNASQRDYSKLSSYAEVMGKIARSESAKQVQAKNSTQDNVNVASANCTKTNVKPTSVHKEQQPSVPCKSKKTTKTEEYNRKEHLDSLDDMSRKTMNQTSDNKEGEKADLLDFLENFDSVREEGNPGEVTNAELLDFLEEFDSVAEEIKTDDPTTSHDKGQRPSDNFDLRDYLASLEASDDSNLSSQCTERASSPSVTSTSGSSSSSLSLLRPSRTRSPSCSGNSTKQDSSPTIKRRGRPKPIVTDIEDASSRCSTGAHDSEGSEDDDSGEHCVSGRRVLNYPRDMLEAACHPRAINKEGAFARSSRGLCGLDEINLTNLLRSHAAGACLEKNCTFKAKQRSQYMPHIIQRHIGHTPKAQESLYLYIIPDKTKVYKNHMKKVMLPIPPPGEFVKITPQLIRALMAAKEYNEINKKLKQKLTIIKNTTSSSESKKVSAKTTRFINATKDKITKLKEQLQVIATKLSDFDKDRKNGIPFVSSHEIPGKYSKNNDSQYNWPTYKTLKVRRSLASLQKDQNPNKRGSASLGPSTSKAAYTPKGSILPVKHRPVTCSNSKKRAVHDKHGENSGSKGKLAVTSRGRASIATTNRESIYTSSDESAVIIQSEQPPRKIRKLSSRRGTTDESEATFDSEHCSKEDQNRNKDDHKDMLNFLETL